MANINHSISKKTIYIVLGVFIFSILATVGGMRTYFYLTSTQYFGEIIEINNGNLLLKIDGDVKKILLVNKDTIIRKGRSTLKEELQVGSYIVVVGRVNQEGSVEARVIRVLDAPFLRK